MKRNIFIKCLIIFAVLNCTANTTFAQKLIQLDDVQNKEYYPSRIYNLNFIPKTNSYYFTKDGKSLWIGNKKEDAKEILNTKDIPNLNSFFNIKFISENKFTFSNEEGIWLYEMDKKQCSIKTKIKKEAKNTEISYKSFNVAYTYNNNIEVQLQHSDNPVQITNDGSLDIMYAEAAHRNEFGINKGLFWSNNGEILAFYRQDQSMVSNYPIVNTSTRIAEVNNVKYPMAGMKSHQVSIGVYDTKTNSTIYLKTRKNESIEEKENYLTNITFSVDDKIIYIAKLNRNQNHMWLEAYDVTTGNFIKTLFEETSQKYVEPENGLFFLPNNPSQFLWLSERDGYNHIYLYDINGKLIKQVTSGNWIVKTIEGFNAKGDEVFFSATKDSPLETNFYGVEIKSGKINRYTKNSGTHSVVFNSEGNLFIDNYSNYINTPNKAILTDKKGNVIKTLHNGENPWANLSMPKIELGTINAKDGTELCYRMIKPHDFNPNKKYPVIVYVYGGPHVQLVTNSWLAGANNFFLFLAQQGYIVWTIDSRGSANRGFEFESAIWHNLGTIEVSDQMDGVNYLKSLPFVDKNRIGVDGWSYGGFMTISMKLKNPGVFKTATAGGPVIDWKWYEVMYGERYMGTPQNNEKGYKEASLLNHVDKLEGKLMVIQGAQDATVVEQNALEFINKCIKEKKQVDYFVYPDHEHNVRGVDRIHLFRKIFEYHKANL